MPDNTEITPTAKAILDRLKSRAVDYDESPVRAREIISLLLIIVLSDVAIYRGEGFAGFAALTIGLPILLLIGVPSKRPQLATWVLGLLLAGATARLAWCGSGLSLVSGLVVLFSFAMSLVGRTPYLLHAAVFASQTFAAGHHGLNHYWTSLAQVKPSARLQNVFAVFLPVVTVLVFGTLFIFANPDLAKAISTRLSDFFEFVSKWWIELAPAPWEIVFCIGAGWIAVGLLRPILPEPSTDDASKSDALTAQPDTAADDDDTEAKSEAETAPETAALFDAFRNTLIVVTALFAAYLVFEFQTLWFREFPQGFHYSGYAHEGAAWLTVALALATVMLSVMFRGSVLRDPRMGLLRKLSWAWSLENVILALAVYNRLSIYVNFNGMTRMRTIGLLGISAVLVGFLLVVRKITRRHDFRWLVRRQLWTLAFAIYLYSVLPIDAWVMRHNVNRILSGDLTPSVQISVHQTSAEGVLELLPLTSCENEIICEGVKAVLAQYQVYSENLAAQRVKLGWTSRQIADESLLNALQESQDEWAEYKDKARREATTAKFHEYVYQWY